MIYFAILFPQILTVLTLTFPGNLKLGGINPLQIKGKKDIKENYRPVSILQNLFKYKKKLYT